MSLLSHKTALFAAVFIFCLTFASSYKYLGILPTGARSHYIVGSSLMKGLARQGHDVTVISPFPLKEPMKNFHDIPLIQVIEAMEDVMANLLSMRDKSVIENIVELHDLGITLSTAVLTEPSVIELMNSNATFDGIICEVFLTEALYGLSEHFNAPLIGVGTFGAIAWNTDMVGSPSPPSYVPNAFLPLTDHMTLLQRVGNLAYLTFEYFYMNYHYLPRQEVLYKQYFPHAKRSMYEVRKNAALVLLNQHVSLSNPRPYVPNQIEVGGMHINRKRTPLPEDIQKFLDEAKHGAIYFSMGSNLKSKSLPLEKRQAILDTFRSLKQRVLWKFEDSDLPGKPDNVYISDWFPQDDILAHANVKAFVTHGGLLSTTESIYHGKPFIGIPIFGDQFMNMKRAEINGYGISLDYNELSANTFKAAITKITTDQSYTKLIRDMSARYRDQPMLPLDKAIFWVEHVSRHKGAKYLHCAGQDLNFVQYHNLDAMLILYGGLLLLPVLFVMLIRLAWCWLQNVCVKKDKKQKKH